MAFALVTMNAWADETNFPREADETSVLREIDFEKLVVIFDRVCGELPTGRITPVDYVRMQEFARAIRDRLKSELQEGYRVDGQQLAEDLQTYFKKYVDFKNQYGLEHPATQSALRTVSFVARLMSEPGFSARDIDQMAERGNIDALGPHQRHEVITGSPSGAKHGRNADERKPD